MHQQFNNQQLYALPTLYLRVLCLSKGNKTVPVKVATTHTEDGHKQDNLNKHYNINQKDEDT